MLSPSWKKRTPAAATTKTDPIPVTGNALSVQIRLNQNGGFEEFVFDNIRITGDLVAGAAPVLANIEGTTLDYAEEDPATQITNALTVTDSDSANLTSASVAITSNLVSTEDVLAFTPPGSSGISETIMSD